MKLNKLSALMAMALSTSVLVGCNFHDKPDLPFLPEIPEVPEVPEIGELEPDVVVTDIASLQSALTIAVDENGDGKVVVGLDPKTGPYTNLGDLGIPAGVYLIGDDGTSTLNNMIEPAVIAGGDACILITNNNVTVSNITFEGVNGACVDDGDKAVGSRDTALFILGAGSKTEFASGVRPGDTKPSGITLSDITIDGAGRAASTEAAAHDIIVRGQANILNNAFVNKPVEVGTFINVRNDSNAHVDTVISGNYFYNLNDGAAFVQDEIDGTTDAGSNFNSVDIYAIQVGTSSSKQNNVTNTQITDNLFEATAGPRRLLRVRASGNTISGNTFLNTYGWVSIEGGESNVFDSNAVLTRGVASAYQGKYETQLRFIGKGDQVTNNYFYRTVANATGNEAGAISIWEAQLEEAGDTTLRAPATVANNTVVNSKQAFLIGKGDASCQTDIDLAQSVIHFKDNLVANGVKGSTSGNNAYRDDCFLNAASTWEGDVYAVAGLSANGRIDAAGATDAQIIADADVEKASADYEYFEAMAGGNVEGKGAMGLTILTSADVGPQSGSTDTAE